ncbi:hypothetical protein Y1Q_0013428 [Alligator mississippiensis]|uniref:Uncharacterized protein n=1 Tax=Alligator mississippiensis TaxID=8496 RepID=A0A151MS87_ALLMI|nr:hypothetical protein Y1Q_0013428 [Alligator mississippiensis]
MDQTFLQWLMAVVEEWEENAQAWWVEDMVHQEWWWAGNIIQEETRDQADQQFWAKLLFLKRQWVQVV